LVFSIIVAAVILLLSIFIKHNQWEFGDWTRFFYPAARSPRNPYEVRDSFYLSNPPWLVWLLIPFSFLPVDVSLATWIVITILLSTWCIKKLGGDLHIVLLSLCSPAFARVIIQGQIDVIPLLGFTLIATTHRTLYRTAGYLLITIKPQVLGLGALVTWLKLDRRERLIVITSIVAVLVLSLIVHGNWPRTIYHTMLAITGAQHGIHLWPYGLPIGLVLLGVSLKNKDERIGGLATLFFVPYIGLHSLFPYIAVLFTMIPKLWAVLLFVLLWVLALIAT
jgi:hypothetical protein